MQGFLDWAADNWLALVTFVAGLAVAVYLYGRQKEPKTLDYAATSQLIGTGSAHSRLQVRWEDILPWEHPQNPKAVRSHLLESPRIVKIHIRNTGKKEIDEDDFKQPITIDVDTGWIVNVSIARWSRAGMFSFEEEDDDLVISETSWQVKPRLLNQGDWLELRVMTEKSPELPKVESWIKGESRSMKLRPELLNTPMRTVIAAKFSSTDSWWTWSAGMAVTLAVLGVILAVVAAVWRN